MALFGIFGKKAVGGAKKPTQKAKPAKVRPKTAHTKPKTKPIQKIAAKKALKPEKSSSKKPTQPKPHPTAKPASIPISTINKIPDSQAYELAKKSSLPLTPYAFVKSEKELPQVLKKIGFPCVMKISGRTIIHKTELGGVKTNLQNDLSAISAFKELVKIKGCEAVIVQKHLSGVELIVGGKSDPSFGYVVSLGLGGIYVEVLKDVTFRVAPITIVDAEAMVKELKGYEILAGARGQKPINFQALHELLVKVSRFIVSQKLKELDLNPVFCSAEGCWIADVRVVK